MCGQFMKAFENITLNGYAPGTGATALVIDVVKNGNGRIWALTAVPELLRYVKGHLLRMPLVLVISPNTRLTVAPRVTSGVDITGRRGILRQSVSHVFLVKV